MIMAGFDMSEMLKQAQQMQTKMQKIQEDLKERIVEGTSGGGAVTVLASGTQEIVKITIAEDAVDEDDIETLEDLLLTAVNNALKASQELSKKEMDEVTGGMNLPGMGGLF
jgi:DNA-binding YbaB/EbfC family protein